MKDIIQFFSEVIHYKPENLNEFQQLVFWVMVLAIIALWCFIDIIGYLFSSYVVKYTDIENKFPKLRKILNYFLKVNYIFIAFQVIYILFIYIFIIGVCMSLWIFNSS